MAFGPAFKTMVETAISGDTTESRALATQAIGRTVRDRSLTDSERDLSARIFRILARDVCEEVRRALAITLRLSDALPPDVANRLIHDVDSIAVPILADSPVITDDDMIAVIESRAGTKLQAIAARRNLSAKVCGAVIQYGDAVSVATLAANDSALISEADAAKMVDLARNDDLIRAAALRRHDMPQALAVKLIDAHVGQIDDALRPVTPNSAQLASDTGTRARTRWATEDWSADALLSYVDALHQRGALDEPTFARAAGQGDWRFVQLALARLAGISVAKAGMMVLDTRPFALQALLRRANLSAAAQALMLASADAFRDLERSHAPVDRRHFQQLMIDRISSHPSATQFGHLWMDWLDDGLGPRQVYAA